MTHPGTYILGAGMSGLAAGMASGLPVLEAEAGPGGICGSYYLRPGSTQRLPEPPADGEAYRFEIGGGHWIFGADPAVLQWINTLAPTRSYTRRSGVYFPGRQLRVPYPVQNHLRCFPADVAARALSEMSRGPGPFTTLKEWLLEHFGPTLCAEFFFPFHELYTAGISDRIAPQDAYKSPLDLAAVRRGAVAETPAAGYNASFVYPIDGLGAVSRRMAERADVRYGHRVTAIDVNAKTLRLETGAVLPYRRLISTLPLNRMMQLTGLKTAAPADPHTSVLVLNLGAKRGAACPDEHWLYVPQSRCGFHRFGIYSNVDVSFLPASKREGGQRVSLYVERSWPGGQRPGRDETARHVAEAIGELQDWGVIGEVDVADPTFIDVAYTWSWPNSPWRQEAMASLEAHSIRPVGRYARWTFQGIADSIRDGLSAGERV